MRLVAETVRIPGGFEAMQLRVAEQYVARFGDLARTNNSMIVAGNVADIATMVATATNVIQRPGGTGR
jgi:hypothetical protein